MDYKNSTYYRTDYATRLTDQHVSGLSFSTSTISSVPSSTNVILSSPSSTTLYTDNDNSKLLYLLVQYYLFELTIVSSNQQHLPKLQVIISSGKFILSIELLL